MAALKRKFEIPQTKLYINKLRLNRFRERHAKSSRRYKQWHVVARTTSRAIAETPETRMGTREKGSSDERNETNENERNDTSADERNERNERTRDDVERVSSELVSVYTHVRSHTHRHELCYVLWGVTEQLYLGVATNICM